MNKATCNPQDLLAAGLGTATPMKPFPLDKKSVQVPCSQQQSLLAGSAAEHTAQNCH